MCQISSYNCSNSKVGSCFVGSYNTCKNEQIFTPQQKKRWAQHYWTFQWKSNGIFVYRKDTFTQSREIKCIAIFQWDYRWGKHICHHMAHAAKSLSSTCHIYSLNVFSHSYCRVHSIASISPLGQTARLNRLRGREVTTAYLPFCHSVSCPFSLTWGSMHTWAH